MMYRIGYGNYFAFQMPTAVPLVPNDRDEIMNVAWVTLDEMEEMPLNIDVNQFRRQSWRYEMNKPCETFERKTRPVSPVVA